jgi:hypothetical protein
MKQDTYQLQFGMLLTVFNGINCDITHVEDNLTFSENFMESDDMDVPNKD